MRDALGDVRGRRVLDLGCGTGRHAIPLAAAGAVVTAVDFSEQMLAAARRKPGASASTSSCTTCTTRSRSRTAGSTSS